MKKINEKVSEVLETYSENEKTLCGSSPVIRIYDSLGKFDFDFKSSVNFLDIEILLQFSKVLRSTSCFVFAHHDTLVVRYSFDISDGID